MSNKTPDRLLYAGFKADTEIAARFGQYWNALTAMLVAALPIVTLVRLKHASNADVPTLMTLLGIATLVKNEQ